MNKITKRKRAEEDLRETNGYLDNLFNYANAPIIVWNPQFIITRFNHAFESITERKMDEVLGASIEILFPPDRMESYMELIRKTLTGEQWDAVEIDIINLDGTIRTLLWNSATIFTDGGKTPVATIAHGHDITKLKQALAERKTMENQLFQAQKMEAIGTLAGGVAHDFNNILAAIIGYTEMAMDEDQKEIQKQYLQETLKGAERAKNLVRQILTFSRHDRSEKKPMDVRLLLKEAVKFLRASIPTTIEIRQDLTDESCNILADITQMHQVIMNLCTNATHAMKQTGGLLKIELSTIELAKGEIPRQPDLKPGPYVKLTVSDTGHGIDPAHINRIFDPFFTTKSQEEGTGLGLFVVFGIVKSHDGVIHVYSEPGKGASFNVYLPRVIHEEITKGIISGAVIGGKERILFVDDEHALVNLGTHILSPLGYDVTGVTSSMEALDLFRTEPARFDLVITDMTLPKMTGIDLSREILKIRPDIPIVLCSGIHESGTEKQAKSMGLRAYCIKPQTRREFSLVIRDAVDGHKNPLPR